jgi:hypothetical protein
MIRKTLAAVALAATLAGSAQAKTSPPLTAAASAALQARLSAVVGIPVVCYPSLDAYFSDSLVAPTSFYLGIAGFYGYSSAATRMVVGLTPAECVDLARRNARNWVFAMAVFVVAHERAHARGQDLAAWLAHQSDPAFVANVDEIVAQFGGTREQAEMEAGADCVGEQTVVATARALGVPASAASASYLVGQSERTGPYVNPLPAYCLAQTPLAP